MSQNLFVPVGRVFAKERWLWRTYSDKTNIPVCQTSYKDDRKYYKPQQT